MDKDQTVGAMILLLSIVGICAYLYLIFLSPWILLTIQISAFMAVSAILILLAWIGYTMATTPSPEPLEDIDFENKPNSSDEDEKENKVEG